MTTTTDAVQTIVSLRSDRDDPLISVAVSTYDRPDGLARLLRALEAQTMPASSFEVVVADNGSDVATARVLREIAATTSLQLHAVRVAPNRGPSGGRNLAWRQARAPLVAFTDDDCAPAPGWLAEGLAVCADGDAVVVGRTLPDPSERMGPFSRSVRVGDVNWLPTCNVFYRRDDLEAVGGFDEGFTRPGGEDTDLAFRVREACGRTFRFARRALVHHDVRPSRFAEAARETQRWVDTPRLFARHPDARERLHRRYFWKPSHPKALLALAGLLLASRSRRWLVLVLPWLHYRMLVRRPPGRRAHAYPALPGVFVVDVLEIVAMVRGAIRHRTPIL